MKKSMKSMAVFFSLALALVAIQLGGNEAWAESAFFTTNCAGCHSTVTATCNGCHAHGTHSSSSKSDINVKGQTSKSTYAPGEAVSVTITGGYRTGWIRAILYDQNMVELSRSTGPNGTGGGAGYPITLSAPAPSTPGTYTWNVAWYGNKYDLAQVGGTTTFGSRWTPDPNNPNHGREIVSTNTFTVAAAAAPDINLNPTSLNFGTVTVGGSSTLASQLQNLGTAALNVTAITPCAGTTGEYTWSPAAPFTVSAGSSQALSVTYKPVDGTTDTGCLDIVSNDLTTPTATLNLSGAGSVPTASQPLDINISGFTASRRVSLNKGKAVQLQLTVTNPGPAAGSADATLVGVQNGASVYSQTVSVNPPVGGTAVYPFPAYKPVATGVITWTVTVADQNPDVDQSTATTTVAR
ncbi:MAG TPA: choice-of-anchor D domain-containing protein [Geobacteraceae bacterium]